MVIYFKVLRKLMKQSSTVVGTLDVFGKIKSRLDSVILGSKTFKYFGQVR